MSRFRVVLVGPENPLNVGLVARAMLCFGLDELVVAGSAWTGMPDEAHVTGSAAAEILGSARFSASLDAALKGCAAAVAFTRRTSTLDQTSFDLPAPPPSAPGRMALVFGRERNGLTKEELAACTHRARIPCRDGVSLNLGQAAAVAFFSFTAPAPAPAPAAAAPAALERVLKLWEYLEPKLRAAPRFTPNKLQSARQMLYRLAVSDDDFDRLFAVMRALGR